MAYNFYNTTVLCLHGVADDVARVGMEAIKRTVSFQDVSYVSLKGLTDSALTTELDKVLQNEERSERRFHDQQHAAVFVLAQGVGTEETGQVGYLNEDGTLSDLLSLQDLACTLRESGLVNLIGVIDLWIVGTPLADVSTAVYGKLQVTQQQEHQEQESEDATEEREEGGAEDRPGNSYNSDNVRAEILTYSPQGLLTVHEKASAAKGDCVVRCRHFGVVTEELVDFDVSLPRYTTDMQLTTIASAVAVLRLWILNWTSTRSSCTMAMRDLRDRAFQINFAADLIEFYKVTQRLPLLLADCALHRAWLLGKYPVLDTEKESEEEDEEYDNDDELERLFNEFGNSPDSDGDLIKLGNDTFEDGQPDQAQGQQGDEEKVREVEEQEGGEEVSEAKSEAVSTTDTTAAVPVEDESEGASVASTTPETTTSSAAAAVASDGQKKKKSKKKKRNKGKN
eukprot:m.38095 g.38095  ORF g.38095 m.38095 type:complete len:453 (+) comp10157_c0_seq1:97-1455(+)